MPQSPSRCRPPLATQPIRSSLDAIAVLSLATARPLEFETIGFFLDDQSRSNTITVITGTTEPDSVLAVAECLALAAADSPTLCGLVLATIRPDSDNDLPATLQGDIDRWIEANSITEAHGIELIEWFVVGRAGVDCPRDLLGDPERWGCATAGPDARRASAAARRRVGDEAARDWMSARRRPAPARRSAPRERRSGRPGSLGEGSLSYPQTRAVRRSSNH